ncbi:hypothetical protein K435DRAFT_858918 [Dendrothele bispora CBS 962.96]|uniref:Chromatin elongation factor spt5 n=1 Tax=Dendrothele bispora (strain CBS 962.96) TaxID=1314807 RepID=A0A4S8M1X0_DENBC|nr:hypothetical protein K435DRAFT_858918 [Dendrothele bispora CBS 962.96]
MPNPFVDIEAQIDDDDDCSPESLDGDNAWVTGDGLEDVHDNVGDGLENWKDEDLLDIAQHQGLSWPIFADYLLERYAKRPTSPPLIGDDALPNTALKIALITNDIAQDTFWRVKCKPGHEADLLMDIMRREMQEIPNTTSNLTSSFQSAEPTRSVQAQAFDHLCSTCVDPNASIPAIEAELKNILGSHYTAQWDHALSLGSPQDPDEDPSAAMDRLMTIWEQLVPHPSSASGPSVSHQPTLPSSSPLRSAFVVPIVIGFIYLEADLGLRPQETDIAEYLRGHKAVIKRQRSFYKSKTLRQNQRRNESTFAAKPWLVKSQVWMERISCEEVATLLSTPTPTIKTYSWVRILRGEYRGDVGLVISRQTSEVGCRLIVLLVPRLYQEPVDETTQEIEETASAKRKRGPELPQTLFNIDDYPGGVTKSNEGENHFIYKGKKIWHDLLCKSLDYSSVSQVDVDMDDATRRLFRASKHPIIQSICLPASRSWTFFYRDRVEVLCFGPLTEAQKQNPDLPRKTTIKYAVVIEVEAERCKVQFDEYAELDEDDTAEWVSKVNLRKRIYEGDGVEVVAGESNGRHGIVAASIDGLLEVRESLANEGDTFWVEANVCRVTEARDNNGVPWLGHLVTIFKGQYCGYQGVVLDVHPPRPYFTSLEVRISRLLLTVSVNHDDVYDSCSHQWLRLAAPLGPQQKHFHQATWDAEYAPNLKFNVYDYHEKRYLVAEDLVFRQPSQPWVGKEVRVVSKEWKALGTVKQVERTGKCASGIRLQVELRIMTAVHGLPVYWFDYAQVYDPKQPTPIPEWRRPTRAQTPPLSSNEFVDPFTSSEPSAGPSTDPQAPPTHWLLDPRLIGAKFYARWVPLYDLPMEKQLVEPTEQGIVKVYSGAEVFIARPEEIYDCAVRIRPSTNKKPIVAVRGEHTGKYMRQIHYKYDVNGKEIVTAAVYVNWGLSNEEYAEQVEVRPEELAETSNDWRHDPNEKRFAPEMKRMREEARKTRVRKPKAQ